MKRKPKPFVDDLGINQPDGTPDPIVWPIVHDIATDAWDDHYVIGAVVAFGLMGMAEAIRSRPGSWRCVDCDNEVAGLAWCPRCP